MTNRLINDGMDPPATARWIWSANSHSDQYLRFRRVFQLAQAPRHSRLTISAETDFILFVNGSLVGHGQYSDWPTRKTSTTYELAPLLRAGDNVIAVCVHHQGLGNSVYCPGQAGLILALHGDHPEVVSDDGWRCAEMPSYAQGGSVRVTLQLGLSFTYDARQEDAWTCLDFPETGWEAVTVRTEGPAGIASLPRS
jgi:alpha-L-rhamnosidase